MPELRFARYRNDFKYTHYLVRFPAKFHPPAVRCLIDRYSTRGDVILDPFCGSGTLMVEALVSGRAAIGLDVDPVAAARVALLSIPAKSVWFLIPGYLYVRGTLDQAKVIDKLNNAQAPCAGSVSAP